MKKNFKSYIFKTKKNKSLILSKAQVSQRFELSTVEKKCFSYDQISTSRFKVFIESNKNLILTIKDEKRIVGYILFLLRKGSFKSRLYSICIDPDYSGQGIAKEVMNQSLFFLKDELKHTHVKLEVKPSNKNAITLYENLGFKKVGRIKNFYTDGEDALVYRKELNKEGQR